MDSAKKSGILISVEGIDGSGKSTLVQYLADQLRKRGHQVLVTKQPGGSQLGILLREILQHKPVNLVPRAEYLLFAADRAQHIAQVVAPALNEGVIVISDRMEDSSLVYQGYGRGEDLAMIGCINHWAMCGIEPHLVIYLRIDPKKAQQRMIERGSITAFEKEQIPFVKKLAEGFDEIFRHRDTVVNIDATLPRANVGDAAVQAVVQRMGL